MIEPAFTESWARRWRVRLVILALGTVTACFDAPTTGDAGDTGGSDTVAEMTVSVSGTVVASWIPPGDTPIEGTLVELVGAPGVSAVTGADGRFTIEGVTAGEVAYLSVAPSTEYLGSVVGVDVPYIDVDDLELFRFLRLDAEMQVAMLRETDPDLAYDASRGAVLVTSSHSETNVSMQPMPAADHYYALDAGGTVVLGATASTFVIPAVVFFNLDIGDAGIVEVSATHPMRTCDVPLPRPPIRADHVSFVSAVCQ